MKYEWDADFGGFEFTPDAEGQTATLSAGDDKPLTRVALRVTTDDGLQAVSPVPAEVDVRNVPPTVTGMGHNPPFVAFGVGYLLIYGKVSDPGGDEVTVRVDFGDGTAPADAHAEFGTFVVEHTYGARGTYTVAATATDDQGASSTGEMTVTTMDLVGRVFQDGNDNGRGGAEGGPGVPGVTVYLDSDGDGTPDEGEPRTASDDAGYYTFPVLDNGTYSVRVVTPPGQRVTNAPSDLAPVTLTGASGVRRDFGLSDRARITGVVFGDADGDGVRDPGETPVQSLVTLRNLYIDLEKDGWYDPTEPTSEAIGDEYAFLNLRPGTYTVRYLPGLTRSDAPDSRAAQTYPYERGGQTGYTVTVGTAEVSSGHDFGSYFGNTAVAGAVYLDRNRDGDRDASSTGEVGLADRVVYLDYDGDGALDPDESRSGTVNPGGTYFLPAVPGRTYTVRTVLPDGWTQSQPNGGAPYIITVNPQDTASLQNRNFGTHVTGNPAVVGRHLFYFRSAFGGGSATDPRDDGAIAADKEALLPGGRASFANVGSYSRGINGVMVDLNDFIRGAPNGNYLHFAVGDGTSQEPTAWKTVFGSVQVRRGAGVGGSDRLVVTFADNAIRNQWLRVTVDPGLVSGLAAPDVFYFGSLVGETGDTLSPFRVTAADLGAIRKALNMNAGVSNRYDVNRDGKVDALDLGLAKANLNRSLPALAIPVPVPVGGAPAPAPASDRDGFLAGLLA